MNLLRKSVDILRFPFDGLRQIYRAAIRAGTKVSLYVLQNGHHLHRENILELQNALSHPFQNDDRTVRGLQRKRRMSSIPIAR